MRNYPALSVKYPLLRRFFRIFVTSLTTMVFVGAIIVPIEDKFAADPVITTIFDGFWWAVTTVTTVGYGDMVPVSNVGRILGVALQLAGVIMFGSLIGTVTAYLNRAQSDYKWGKFYDKIEQAEKERKKLDKKIDFLVKNVEVEPKRKPTQWGL